MERLNDFLVLKISLFERYSNAVSSAGTPQSRPFPILLGCIALFVDHPLGMMNEANQSQLLGGGQSDGIGSARAHAGERNRAG